MNYVFRLTKGQDLKKEMVNYVKQKNIKAGIVKCGVGCVYEAKIRLADGHTIGGYLVEELENYTFTREFDKNTGYDELVIK